MPSHALSDWSWRRPALIIAVHAWLVVDHRAVIAILCASSQNTVGVARRKQETSNRLVLRAVQRSIIAEQKDI